jgi:hypothetical protein
VFRGSRVYSTPGDNGALSVFDSESLALQDSFDLHDARWVDVNDGKVVVVQGTPAGQISLRKCRTDAWCPEQGLGTNAWFDTGKISSYYRENSENTLQISRFRTK